MTSVRCSRCKVDVPASMVGIANRCVSLNCPVNALVRNATDDAADHLFFKISFEVDEIAKAHREFARFIIERDIPNAMTVARQLSIMTDHIATVLRRDQKEQFMALAGTSGSAA